MRVRVATHPSLTPLRPAISVRVVLAQITLQIMALTYAVRNVMVASWDVLVDSLVRRRVVLYDNHRGDGWGVVRGRGGEEEVVAVAVVLLLLWMWPDLSAMASVPRLCLWQTDQPTHAPILYKNLKGVVQAWWVRKTRK